MLTWWQGYIPPQGFGQGEEMIYSSSYQQLGRVHAGNGYKADLHDFHITPQGAALLTVFDPIDCNLSAVGGPSGGAVTDSVFQEIDMATGLVRREWHSLDHVALSESYSSPEGVSTQWPFDFFHINSIDQLAGGNTLISARNTWALYELNTTTGQVGLRVGGKRSNVKLLNGAGDRVPARRDRAAERHDQPVRQRRRAEGPSPVARDRPVGERRTPAPTRCSPATSTPPRLSSGSQGSVQTMANGEHVRRLGLGAVLLGIQLRRAAALRRALARLLPDLPRLPLPLDGHARRAARDRRERAPPAARR